MVQLDDGANQRQAQPGAVALSGGVDAIEALEKTLLHLRSDSGTGILDFPNGGAVILA